jgi:adenosylmethionine-8-amino-7-oxononanoate aminotransferase
MICLENQHFDKIFSKKVKFYGKIIYLNEKAFEIFLDCLAHGVLVRSAGDNLVLAPAYIATPSQIAQMVDTLAASIKRHA